MLEVVRNLFSAPLIYKSVEASSLSSLTFDCVSVLQDVYAKVHEIMTGNLGAAGTTQGLNISPGSQGLLVVCASMRVLGVLEECCREYANRFTTVLVKLINRVARDHASPGGFVLDSSRQGMGRSRCIFILTDGLLGVNWSLHKTHFSAQPIQQLFPHASKSQLFLLESLLNGIPCIAGRWLSWACQSMARSTG